MRLVALPLALLFVLAVVVSASNPDCVPLFLWGRLSFLVFLTPVVMLFTAAMGVTLLYAIERALGHDVRRYERMGAILIHWMERLMLFHAPGASDEARTRALAERRVEAKRRRITKPSTFTHAATSATEAESDRRRE